jgi:predicted nucleic acid-binding protein
MRYLLDTNVIIDYLNGSSEAIKFLDHHLITGEDLSASFFTRIELLAFNQLTTEDEQEFSNFLASFKVLPMDMEIERATIAVSRGTKLKLPDSIIVATALVADATLVSRDRHMNSLVWPGLNVMTF